MTGLERASTIIQRMNDLRAGTRVRITGREAEVIGRIEMISAQDEPTIPGFRDDEQTAAILREWGVTRIAYISYRIPDEQEVMFCALEVKGAWRDLDGKPLELEIVGQHG